MSIKQHNIVMGLKNHFEDKDQVTRRELAEIEKAANTELASSDVRIRLRNDADNECVICDIRHPQGLRDSFSVTWAECLGQEPESKSEFEWPDEDSEEMTAVLKFADKSDAQWANLKDETKQDWIERYRASI